MLKKHWITLVVVATFGLAFHVDANPRRTSSPWKKYERVSVPDQLPAARTAAGVIIVDRDDIRFTPRGDAVRAVITREWAMLVNDPAGIESCREMRLLEFPGQRIASLGAARVRGSDASAIEPKKSPSRECSLGKAQSETIISFSNLEPGDVIAVEYTIELDARNPFYAHAFDTVFPVVQTDLTLEIPKELMEGKAARGFHWWAGPLGTPVPEEVWEKPTSWRFRWGRANLAPVAREEERSFVASSWLFDAKAAHPSRMADTDARARYDDTNPAYHGPTLSATRLSGRFAGDRHEGRRTESAAVPTEASFGDLSWDRAGQEFIASIASLLERGASVARDVPLPAAAAPAERIEQVSRHVFSRVGAYEAPLRATLDRVHDPAETYAAGCGSELDRTILLASVLRARGLEARPVLYKRDHVEAALMSVSMYDAIGVVVTTPEGDFYIDPSSGNVSSRPAGGPWGAALITELPASSMKPRLLVGEALATLLDVN
jgi:hypothetical protein